MALKDFREYIARLDEIGELQRIEEEVDPHLEVGAIIRRSYDLGAPAPFFQNLKGYPKEYRILGAPAGASSRPDQYLARLAISLGLKPDSPALEIMDKYIRGKNNPIKPILVSSGPCKENIIKGDEVNLEKFPAPYIHEGDGGRYIGTWHSIVVKDPESNWVNWGMYRLMLHDKKSMGGLILAPQHIGMIYSKYEERNKPMEFAIVFGGPPVVPVVSASMLDAGISEVEVAGGIQGEPIELVKCETVDLEVPASAEIVLEGEVLPHERKMEGPFGEYTGYRGGIEAPKPIYHVKAITHRNDPILPVSCMGVPVDDSHSLLTVVGSAEILDELRKRQFPIKMVYLPPHGVSHTCFISTKVPYPNYVKRLAHFVWGTKLGQWLFQLVIVDDDVDVTNPNEVLHAFSTRCHPSKGIYQVPDVPGHLLLPFLSPEDRPMGKGGGYVLFDCTWPLDWPKETIPVKASFDVLWPKEIQDKVLSKWNKYGY